MPKKTPKGKTAKKVAEVAHSPVPSVAPASPVPSGMDFYDALRAMVAGSRVARRAWPEGERGFIAEGFLTIKRDGVHRWILGDGDIAATDWYAC